MRAEKHRQEMYVKHTVTDYFVSISLNKNLLAYLYITLAKDMDQ